MTKMTYTMAIDSALMVLDAYFGIDVTMTEPIDRDEVYDKLVALRAQLEKRNSGNRKPSKAQRENEGLKEDFWAYVSENGAKRASEVAVYFNVSGQKASALLNALVKEGRLVKFAEKRVTYFRVAEGM